MLLLLAVPLVCTVTLKSVPQFPGKSNRSSQAPHPKLHILHKAVMKLQDKENKLPGSCTERALQRLRSCARLLGLLRGFWPSVVWVLRALRLRCEHMPWKLIAQCGSKSGGCNFSAREEEIKNQTEGGRRQRGRERKREANPCRIYAGYMHL